jgi:signal peptidase I
MTNRTRRWLWTSALLACAVLALKSFVPWGLYHVDTASMEPTILGTRQGGEWVLVVYDRSPPARFDLVVVLRKGEDTPVVKRVAGLPGERVQIVDGDLLVNGERLGPEEPRPRAIPVFDERWQDPQVCFPITPATSPFWKREQGEWTLVARTGTGARAASRLEFHGDVKDSYLDAEHALVAGEIPVNDLALEFELEQDEPGTRASVTLSEEGDVFELALELARDGRLGARLLRRGEDPSAEPETLATGTFERGAPGWHRVRFSNIDNALVFERDGVRLLEARYAENRFARNDRLQEGHNVLPRASFGGADGTLRFRGLLLSRDLYYTQRGEFATRSAGDLGPDGCFLLGDNSSFSRDGREWGETRADEIIGRPARIVWPLSHWRSIEGAVPPPPRVR